MQRKTKSWWIHLRARIPASHAGHRGSNPLSTTKNEARRCRRNSISFVFDSMPKNLFVRHSSKNKVVDLSTPCEVILFRPPRRAEGKGVKRSEQGERSSQSPIHYKANKTLISASYLLLDHFYIITYKVTPVLNIAISLKPTSSCFNSSPFAVDNTLSINRLSTSLGASSSTSVPALKSIHPFLNS